MKYNITQSGVQRYVYFRTAKCGTSSILNILRKNTKISVDEHNIEFDEIWNDYFKFTIVRNPWSRLLSCWLNKIVLEGKGVLDWKDVGTIVSYLVCINPNTSHLQILFGV